jgi:hypothetical protein
MIHSPVEHALRLLISGAPDAALRWSAAALESDAASPAALVVTAHALWRVGQKRAAIDAFTAAARRAALASDAPLAIAAIAELRTVGVDVEKLIAEVAEIVCGESSLEPPWAESPAWRGSLQPVSPMLTRNALVSRATQLVYEAAGAEHPQSTTTTFLGALSPATFRELALALHAMIVPPGFHAVEEDRESLDLYILASGEVEISRRGGRSGARPLATLESGSMFGEMSMLASLPAATSAITTQPAILLFASRDAFEAIGLAARTSASSSPHTAGDRRSRTSGRRARSCRPYPHGSAARSSTGWSPASTLAESVWSARAKSRRGCT